MRDVGVSAASPKGFFERNAIGSCEGNWVVGDNAAEGVRNNNRVRAT